MLHLPKVLTAHSQNGTNLKMFTSISQIICMIYIQLRGSFLVLFLDTFQYFIILQISSQFHFICYPLFMEKQLWDGEKYRIDFLLRKFYHLNILVDIDVFGCKFFSMTSVFNWEWQESMVQSLDRRNCREVCLTRRTKYLVSIWKKEELLYEMPLRHSHYWLLKYWNPSSISKLSPYPAFFLPCHRPKGVPEDEDSFHRSDVSFCALTRNRWRVFIKQQPDNPVVI